MPSDPYPPRPAARPGATLGRRVTLVGFEILLSTAAIHALAVPSDYRIAPGTHDLGGGTSASTAYRSFSSFGGIGGTIGSDGDDFGVRHGFSGQLDIPSAVVGRHIFYDQSAWDIASDDQAIAPDKIALLPGLKAGFKNYTSYTRGLNGIMVDISDLPGSPTTADFTFLTGNSTNIGSWLTAPAPSAIEVRRGAGDDGTDRIVLHWGSDAVKKQWLRIRVEATAATGLGTPDVFYFGNAVGEAGNRPGVDAVVNATDEILARANPRDLVSATPITFLYDYNRDQVVDEADQVAARLNTTSPFTALAIITPPLVGAGGSAASSFAIAGAAPAGAFRVDVERLTDGRLRLVARDPGAAGIQVETSADGEQWQPLSADSAAALGHGISWVVDPAATEGHRLFRLASPPSRVP